MSTWPEIPGRRDALSAFTADGSGFAAVYPIHYPRALLRAFALLPVEVWGPPKLRGSDGSQHLQAYVCSIVRNGLSFVLEGSLDAAAVIVVPHCCDSLQGLGSLLLDFVKPAAPVLPLYLPRARGSADLDFLTAELGQAYQKLVQITGREPDREMLLQACLREEQADARLIELYQRRAGLPCDDRGFYKLVRSREYLPAERFTALAEQALALPLRSSPPSQVPLLLSGIVPEPDGLFDTLAAVGAHLVADDLACAGRRRYPAGQAEDPLRRMAESLLGGPPDPMLAVSIAERIAGLRAEIAQTGARGVVFHTVKFCEPELFDLPQIQKALEADGVACLALEFDLSDPLAHQVVTRLEAFVEMLS